MTDERHFVCAAATGRDPDSCECNGEWPCRDAPDGPVKDRAMAALGFAPKPIKRARPTYADGHTDPNDEPDLAKRAVLLLDLRDALPRWRLLARHRLQRQIDYCLDLLWAANGPVIIDPRKR